MSLPKISFIKPLIALVCLAWIPISAQQIQNNPPAYGLAVELTGRYRHSPPLPVPGGTRIGGFHSLPEGKPFVDGVPIVSLDIETSRDGDVVKIKLTLNLDNSKEIPVATYQARENETVITPELTQYGIEPLQMRVVRAKPRIPAEPSSVTPEAKSRVKAIEIVGIEWVSPTQYQLSLRNISSKNINTMFIDIFTGESKSGYIEEKRPLILPGEIHQAEIDLGPNYQESRDFASDTSPKLVVSTVVFEDGTYEGEVEQAAGLDARRRGQEIQRRKVLTLLEKALADRTQGPAAALEQLKEATYSLKKDADTGVVSKIASRYPSLRGTSEQILVSEVGGGLHNVKSRLLMEIKGYERLRERAPERADFWVWLRQTKEEFEKLNFSEQQ